MNKAQNKNKLRRYLINQTVIHDKLLTNVLVSDFGNYSPSFKPLME